MTQIIVDAGLRSKLHDLRQPLDLCDESGKVLARLIPVLDESQYERVEPQLSPEELQRRMARCKKSATSSIDTGGLLAV